MTSHAALKQLRAYALTGALLLPCAASAAVFFEPAVERAPGTAPLGLEVLESASGIQLTLTLDEAFADEFFATISVNLSSGPLAIKPAGVSAPAPYNAALLPIFPGTENSLIFSFPIGADLAPGPIVSWLLQAPAGTAWAAPIQVTGLVEGSLDFQDIDVTATIRPIPEPAAAVLTLCGLMLTALLRRKRARDSLN